MVKKTAIITGASSGIGRAAAIALAKEGYRVVLAARRLEKLQNLAESIRSRGGEALSIRTDLGDSRLIEDLVKGALDATGRIDLLVNNAGFGRLIWLEEQDLEKDIAAQIQVNLTGSLQLTRAVLPTMLAQQSGQIVFISSVAGFVGVPTYSIYSASKYGIRGFAQSLRRELRGKGIQVSVVYPGAVATEFDRHAGVDWKTTRVTPGWLLLSAEDVAEEIVRVVQRGKNRVILPRVMNLAIWGNIFFPGLVGWLLSRSFYREKGRTVAWNSKDEG